MRVLQINKFFFEKGGSERYFFSVSRSLEKRGHTLIHFSMRHPKNIGSPFSGYFVEEKDYSESHGGFDSIRLGASFIRSREAASRLAELIKQSRPDIAHLHNIYHQITPSIIPVLDNGGIPVVMTLHDYKLVCPKYGFFDGRGYCDRCRGGRFYQAALSRCSNGSFARGALLAAEAYWQRKTRVYERVRFFLCPSRYMRDQHVIEGFDADRVVYLPPYVLLEKGNCEPPGVGAVLDTLPAKFILYFGRLGPEKGLLTLLDAVAHSDDVALVVCGDGPLRESLEADADVRLAGRVTFTGYLPKPVLDRVIERAAAVVMPSEWPENAPFTVLESMSLGVPVIVSNMGGLPELAAMGGCVVFEAGDANGLAARIAELWLDPGRSRSLGEGGRKVIADTLTEARHLDALEKIYERAMGGAVND
jgi:glycosyltransferase involved in cell wall biosynthesis